MIFQKRVKKKLDLEFYIGNHTIDTVHENTHLGTRTSSTGNCRREGASPRKSVVQSSCQYDVMSRFGDFSKWRAKSLLMRRIK